MDSGRNQRKKSVLETKANTFAHLVYKITKNFPSEERFGITSQVRRASLSVVLNIIEGFARANKKEYKNFLRISYASLHESIYVLEFSKDENLIQNEHETDYQRALNLADEIGAMLWKTMQKLSETDKK